MSISSIRSILVADSIITGLVGDKVFAGFADKEVEQPFIILEKTGRTPNDCKVESSTLDEYGFAVTGVAISYSVMEQIMTRCRQVLDLYTDDFFHKVSFAGLTERYDGTQDYAIETHLYRSMVSIEPAPLAVRCIAANNEYLSSPNFNPFPNGVSDVDIEFTLEPSIIDGVKYLIYSDIETGFDAYQLTISTASDTIIFSMRNNGNLNVTNFNGIAGTSLNNGGKIGIKYNATTGDIDMFWDDILISSVTPTTNAFTGVTTEPLVFFGRNQTGAGISATYDGSVSYIKIGSKEWKSFNWKSPITTNSQGVQTTLHSDDNTDAMIIKI